MWIKIVRCSDNMYWYVHHIGNIYKVVRTESDCHFVRAADGYLNIVMFEDCVEVDEKDEL